jgi:hypothetical protein
VLPVGSLRALAVARVGVVGPMRVTHGFRARQFWRRSGFVSDIKDCYWELRDQASRSKLADRPVR